MGLEQQYFIATTWWNNDHRRKILLEQKIEDEMSPRGERQGGDGEREKESS